MTITVYYGEISNAPVSEPSNVFRQFVKDQQQNLNMNGLHFCPAAKEYYKNTFAVKNIHHWTLIRDNDQYHSDTSDVSTFERYFLMREKSIGFFSMLLPELVVLPDKSVEMELIQPSLSRGDINLKTIIPSGKFNPYYHIRKLELPFYFTHKQDKIDCKADDELYYLKFCTDEKIVFKRFFINDEFCKLMNDNTNQKNFNSIPLPLRWWYEKNELVKIRERAMRIIKDNLSFD